VSRGSIRDPELEQPAREAAAFGLCAHCLGRCFARVDHGYGNDERGRILAKEHSLELVDPDDCHVCEGLMGRIDRMTEVVEDALEGHEFDTFLVGARVGYDVQDREGMVFDAIGAEDTEQAKSELNREIGKRVDQRNDGPGPYDWTVGFDAPEVNPIIDTRFDHVDFTLKSLFLYGRYRKHARDIPQTKWPCRNCDAVGCRECGGTGKTYLMSVEELIAQPAKRAAAATEAKFHGAGREDVDARCLGQGRPFVLELVDAKRRKLNLDVLKRSVNTHAAPAVTISNLAVCGKDAVAETKQTRGRKDYLAQVAFEEPVPTETLLKACHSLEGEDVAQRTPSRVAHRRTDKTRHRRVERCSVRSHEGDRASIVLRGEAGLYVKELVSGDKGRCEPSLAGLLETAAECTALDIVDVEGPKALDATIRPG